MKRLVLLIVIVHLLAVSSANGCIGRKITVGTTDAVDSQLLSEMIAALITERTGTTVEVQVLAGKEEIYESIKEGSIGIFIEDSAAARQRLGLQNTLGPADVFETIKQEYREKYGAAWLEPFTISGSDPMEEDFLAPIVSYETLSDFPGLPRLLNKLAEKLSGEDLGAMTAGMDNGSDLRRAARAYLDAIKLI